MKEIPLGRTDFVTKVDDSMFEWLCKFSWVRSGTKGRFYASTKINKKCVAMHRLIMGAKSRSEWVDHEDRDSLNNQSYNLRKCTPSENGCNRVVKAKSKSAMKGVWWCKHHNSWRAQIAINGKRIPLGSYAIKLDAAFAYNEAAKKYHGEFAFQNDIGGYIPDGGTPARNQRTEKRVINKT